ncbi:MAG: DciA family protein [Acidobacteria bacterium]|nr:DciA family protein [Acidobacteriota bacterium]
MTDRAHAGRSNPGLTRRLQRTMIAAHACVTSALRTLLRDQPLSTGKVALAWDVAVGRAMARISQVSLSNDGILDVRVPDRHWAREIHRSGGLITSRINALLGAGAVKHIDVTIHSPR